MCGIVGFISNKYSLENKENLIRRMADAIRHRGPDDDGYFVDETIALGMRRLSIIDLQTGKQPIFNEDKSKVIVFNGEIYNYLDLKKQLLQSGHIFNTTSDTEVILHLFEQKGVDCVKDLQGMFAFAIYDVINKSVFIARDRYGMKPLYYSELDGQFIFGSELKTILQFPNIKKEIDFEALNYYLTFEHVPAPLSIFVNINKLEQGNYILIKNNKITINKYFNLSFQPKFEEKNINFYIENLDNLIDKAVASHTISDVPLGAFLSGGVDSSLITSYLVRHSNQKVKTFSISFSDKSFDESAYSQQVAKHLHTEHYEKQFSPSEFLDVFPKLNTTIDEPFADASLLPTYLLSKFTKQYVTVALSGDASDELFGGYPTYFAGKISPFLPQLSYRILHPLASLLPVSDNNISFDFKVKKFVEGLRYSKNLRHQIWLGSFTPHQKAELFTKNIQMEIKNVNKLEILENFMQLSDTEPNWERSLWCDMRFYLQDNMLVKVDRASMLATLEVRVPFLDNNLAEFAQKIPAVLKYHGTTSKYILKQLAKKYLPENIINRPKKGFGIPIAKWIKCELKDTFIQTFDTKKLQTEGIFNPKFIHTLLNQHLQNRKDNRKLLWTLFMFQKWMDNFS